MTDTIDDIQAHIGECEDYFDREEKKFQEEQKMTDEIKPEYKNFEYLGKKIHKEGIIAEGKKNAGKAYKMYKVSFKNGEYEKEITAFSPMGGKSKQLEDLKEGTVYNVGWKPGEQGVRASSMFFIGDAKKEEKKLETDSSAPTPAASVPVEAVGLKLLSEVEVKEMAGQYKQQVDPKIMSPNHFLGTIIKTENKDLVKFVDKIYEEMIK